MKRDFYWMILVIIVSVFLIITSVRLNQVGEYSKSLILESGELRVELDELEHKYRICAIDRHFLEKDTMSLFLGWGGVYREYADSLEGITYKKDLVILSGGESEGSYIDVSSEESK